MATQVLRPHDCLIQRLRFPRRRNYQPAPPTNRRQQQQQQPAKPDNNRRNKVQSEPSVLRRSSSDPDNLKTSKNALGMEKVTILKRGESLDSFIRPDSKVYAGSGFVVSPEPSDLPVPSFSKKKNQEENATRDLRKLLGLN